MHHLIEVILIAFFVFWLGYKIFYRTKVIRPIEVDLITGKREIDEQEQKYLAEQEFLWRDRKPTLWQKIWSFA